MTKDANMPPTPPQQPETPAPPAPRRKARAEAVEPSASVASVPVPAATPAAPPLAAGLGVTGLDVASLDLGELDLNHLLERAATQQPAVPVAEPPQVPTTVRVPVIPISAVPIPTATPTVSTPTAPPSPVPVTRATDQVVIPPEVLAATPAVPAAPLAAVTLRPRFPSSGPFLSRFLPEVPASQTGLQRGFCDLHDYLHYLNEQLWYGYLYAELGEQTAYVLIYEGRAVAAACLSSTGEQALGELLHLYEQGARLSAYPLDSHIAHVLSGVGSRAWKFSLTPDFTGLHAQPDRATFYDMGRVVAVMPAGLPYEGAFPAPLRPQTLTLPRSLAGWAHHSYTPTLRGRDAVNAITPAHQAFKAKFGAAGLHLQAALLEGLSPAEYALRSDMPLHELEAIVQELIALGYIKGE